MRGYESISGDNYSDSEGAIGLKIIKFLIIFIIILILILAIFYIFNIFKGKSNKNNSYIQLIDPIQNKNNEFDLNQQKDQLNNQEIKNYSISDFKEIYPRINIESGEILNLSDLFKSRKLFINENNITNDYIHFLRPFNQQEEKNREIINQNEIFDIQDLA